jgi:hypothetical protein
MAEGAGPDPIEQLQRAALTAIGATRVLLDALEAVVADRARIEHLASEGRAVANGLFGGLFGAEPTSTSEPDGPDEEPDLG